MMNDVSIMDDDNIIWYLPSSPTIQVNNNKMLLWMTSINILLLSSTSNEDDHHFQHNQMIIKNDNARSHQSSLLKNESDDLKQQQKHCDCTLPHLTRFSYGNYLSKKRMMNHVVNHNMRFIPRYNIITKKMNHHENNIQKIEQLDRWQSMPKLQQQQPQQPQQPHKPQHPKSSSTLPSYSKALISNNDNDNSSLLCNMTDICPNEGMEIISEWNHLLKHIFIQKNNEQEELDLSDVTSDDVDVSTPVNQLYNNSTDYEIIGIIKSKHHHYDSPPRKPIRHSTRGIDFPTDARPSQKKQYNAPMA